tara:strand:- start:6454 stop:7668 length:1215 start_codon:yes stop_codon:yes gene_type:complete
MEIFGSKGFYSCDEKDFLKKVDDLENNSAVPFNDISNKVLHRLSSELLMSSYSKKIPQLVALGFWLRPAQINDLYLKSKSQTDNSSIAVSRGLAFHLPPQNVDTLFVYSWSLSLLAGNINVVRLPSEMTDVLKWLVDLIFNILKEFGIEHEQIFCRYTTESDLTSLISEKSDLRMIWGGDSKVKLISTYPVRPDGLSLGFPNRNSFCVMSSDSYSQLSDKKKNNMAEKLFNDIYWFDQMGCGSPKAIFWLKKDQKIAEDLYVRLDNTAKLKKYNVESNTSLSKFSFMNDNVASNNAASGKRFSSRLSVLNVESNKKMSINLEGAGMLYDIELDDITEIEKFLDRTTQTITHMGLGECDLNNLKKIMSKYGGYRLVPVGEALNFSYLWDGIDLILHMTRKISVKI